MKKVCEHHLLGYSDTLAIFLEADIDTLESAKDQDSKEQSSSSSSSGHAMPGLDGKGVGKRVGHAVCRSSPRTGR